MKKTKKLLSVMLSLSVVFSTLLFNTATALDSSDSTSAESEENMELWDTADENADSDYADEDVDSDYADEDVDSDYANEDVDSDYADEDVDSDYADENANKDDADENADKSQKNIIKIQSSDLSIYVNGEKISFPDAQPFIDSTNRTQVPVRFIAEALGYKVDWSSSLQSVYIYYPNGSICISIGGHTLSIFDDFGKSDHIWMDTVAILKNNRTYVPLRCVAETLGYTVEWE